MMTILHKAQRGFSLITAIFLLVVLSALGAMMLTFFAAQQQSAAIDALGSRAFQAARTGAEWGTFQIIQSQVVGKTFADACKKGNQPSSSVSLADTPLSLFNLLVSCDYTSTPTDPVASGIYNITATISGVNGVLPGSADYIQRVIQTSINGDSVASGVIYQRESY